MYFYHKKGGFRGAENRWGGRYGIMIRVASASMTFFSSWLLKERYVPDIKDQLGEGHSELCRVGVFSDVNYTKFREGRTILVYRR